MWDQSCSLYQSRINMLFCFVFFLETVSSTEGFGFRKIRVGSKWMTLEMREEKGIAKRVGEAKGAAAASEQGALPVWWPLSDDRAARKKSTPLSALILFRQCFSAFHHNYSCLLPFLGASSSREDVKFPTKIIVGIHVILLLWPYRLRVNFYVCLCFSCSVYKTLKMLLALYIVPDFQWFLKSLEAQWCMLIWSVFLILLSASIQIAQAFSAATFRRLVAAKNANRDANMNTSQAIEVRLAIFPVPSSIQISASVG